MRVFGARCIVKEDKVSETTKSGIVLTERKNQQGNRGTVISVGDGAIANTGERIPMSVQVGDRVVYAPYSGTAVLDDEKSETYMILNERDILAVLD